MGSTLPSDIQTKVLEPCSQAELSTRLHCLSEAFVQYAGNYNLFKISFVFFSKTIKKIVVLNIF
jgi:hypothetical protein